MPIYEYQCQSCGRGHEAFQSMSEQALSICPHCHEPKLTKLISSTSFQLKGTGWYATDIRDKDKPKPTTDDKAAS
ncbi:MAG TPA: zinc ribbon domain-containing protein [Gammaproteobacteria bacterium]|jgi:putative FmdB family regulatory protein|nr:zinc ribbon domain-containing protein [Gammaproteobacteria bacterium]